MSDDLEYLSYIDWQYGDLLDMVETLDNIYYEEFYKIFESEWYCQETDSWKEGYTEQLFETGVKEYCDRKQLEENGVQWIYSGMWRVLDKDMLMAAKMKYVK